MSTIKILVGIPGSGKSTLAEKLADTHTIISCDKIREKLYGDASIQGGGEVWVEFHWQIADAVKNKENIVVDNTNCKSRYRKDILDKMRGTGYHVEYVVFTTPLWKCVERNYARERKVPEEVIYSMYKNLVKDFHLLYTEPDKVTFINGDETNETNSSIARLGFGS